ncbi:DegT/DnrJ/EryC1/StrS family aminotransferase [Candidatus Poribacteria bacterium]|nr:DegT/DnrJ/EryC1/StrS family aminotransferase [Candidatus Poribacteria bacterium]
MIKLMIPEVGLEELELIKQVLDTGYLTTGPMTQRFEELVSDYLGIKYAVACSSGTTALHLALVSLGIGPGDEVLLPDFTFPSCANVVRHCGAIPILVDIDLNTLNINVDDLEKKITHKSKAIMPVHLFGLSADMDPILALAKKHNLFVMEDAACALGAEYKGRKCGTMGDIGCFSFHPRKIITTGEGGMIVTNDKERAERLRSLRNHGMGIINGERVFVETGYNYRLSDVLGAIGVAQMKKLDYIIAKHIEIAGWYKEYLSDSKILTLPEVPNGYKHIYQTYTVLLSKNINRQLVIQALLKNDIEANIGTYSISIQPAYQPCEILPNSLNAHRNILALPLQLRMTREDVARIATILKDILGNLDQKGQITD